MDLGIDHDELNMCVQCGLCLSACPTFRVTGDETHVAARPHRAMREVQVHDAPLTPEVVTAFETCVQCRGCEPACPSGVPYGRLMERTREALVEHGRVTPGGNACALGAARPSPPAAGRLGRCSASPSASTSCPDASASPPPSPSANPPPRPHPFAARNARRSQSGHKRRSTDRVYLFTGCVMDAWQRDVHLAGQRVLEAAGFEVRPHRADGRRAAARCTPTPGSPTTHGRSPSG